MLVGIFLKCRKKIRCFFANSNRFMMQTLQKHSSPSCKSKKIGVQGIPKNVILIWSLKDKCLELSRELADSSGRFSEIDNFC